MGNERNSSVEVLKLIAMFLIVLFHVSITVSRGASEELPSISQQFINVGVATTNIQYLIIGLFHHLGALGNLIFFVCSFWFLSCSKGVKLNKILLMILDVWVISVLFLLVIIRFENLPMGLIIKCLFPNSFCSNWFVTCYLIIYAIHPLLNQAIDSLNKRAHASFCLISVLLYNFWVFLIGDVLFSSRLIQAVVLYFLVAYIKKYTHDWIKNIKLNIILLFASVIGVVGMYLITNYLGFHFSVFNNHILRWSSTTRNNPLIILSALALLNLFGQVRISSRAINYMSGLSMLIYLIHENILFKTYTRVRIWAYILNAYGETKIVLLAVIFAIVLFTVSIVIAFLYTNSLHRLVMRIERNMEPLVMKGYNYVLGLIMKVR